MLAQGRWHGAFAVAAGPGFSKSLSLYEGEHCDRYETRRNIKPCLILV